MLKRTRDEPTGAYLFDTRDKIHMELYEVCLNRVKDPTLALIAASDLLMCLYCKSKTSNCLTLSMPPFLDALWHELICETVLYQAVCNTFYTTIIHHTKKTVNDPVPIKQSRILATQNAIKELEPDFVFHPTIWEGENENPKDSFIVSIKDINGVTRSCNCNSKTTIIRLKEMLKEQTGYNVGEQRLLFAGSELKDEMSLEDYGIHFGVTMYLVMRVRGC